MSFSLFIKPTITKEKSYEFSKNQQTKINNKTNVDKNTETEDKDTNNIKTNNNHNTSDILVNSLIALATIGTPTAIFVDNLDTYDNPHQTEVAESMPEEEIICNPKALARGGENDSIVELNELMTLLNFDSTNELPKSEIEAIKTVAMANLKPVYANDKDAKEKITSQIQNVQNWIDNAANDYKINPPKSEFEKKIEYNSKYITDKEILANVDISELSRYQKDKTVLAALISGSRERIARDDADAVEKAEKQIEDAQALVDKITERYRNNSKIAGNTDFDNTLSKKELVDLLDLRSLEGLPKNERTKILRNAIKGYKPVMFDIKNKNDIRKTNEQLTEIVQATQNQIDRQADAQKRKAVGLL